MVKRNKTNNIRLQSNSKIPRRLNGKWTFKESELFVKFIKDNIDIMKNLRKRRKNKIFEKMSDYLLTRTSLQCSGHFHIIFRQYQKDIFKIINHHLFDVYSLLHLAKSKTPASEQCQKQQLTNSEKNDFKQAQKKTMGEINSYGFTCKIIGKNIQINLDLAEVETYK